MEKEKKHKVKKIDKLLPKNAHEKHLNHLIINEKIKSTLYIIVGSLNSAIAGTLFVLTPFAEIDTAKGLFWGVFNALCAVNSFVNLPKHVKQEKKLKEELKTFKENNQNL